jgi:peptidoglycan hydrolase-like protein with peptidoglycan-binding domain
MNRLGFNAGTVDGILGRNTDASIKRMQKYLGTYQDGLVGPITRGLLNNSCN